MFKQVEYEILDEEEETKVEIPRARFWVKNFKYLILL